MSTGDSFFIVSLILIIFGLVLISYLAGRFDIVTKLSRKNNDRDHKVLDKSYHELKFIMAEQVALTQKNLRSVATDMSNYAKQELNRITKDEIKNYEVSMVEVRQSAINSIIESQAQAQQQQLSLIDKLDKELAKEKERRIGQFENNMTDIVNHYIQEAIGNHLELRDQFPIIIADLESKKAAIIEDINHGA
jgi:hypothetical protein